MPTDPTQTDEQRLEELWTKLCDSNGTPDQYVELHRLQEILREQDDHEQRILQENKPS